MTERRERGARAQRRGRGAEERAARWLTRRGFRIVERNLRTAAGEIDLVAWQRGTLCFIEVKARSRSRWQRAGEALSAGQMRRLRRAALLYLGRFEGSPPPCRFDLVTLDGSDSDGWSIAIFEDAFQAV